MKKETRAWIRKAEGDWRAAVHESSARDPERDVVAFHCQQSAEKYLKALLLELGQPIPKIHDLDQLLAILLPFQSSLKGMKARPKSAWHVWTRRSIADLRQVRNERGGHLF
jgi:HEPN domain-containing protein